MKASLLWPIAMLIIVVVGFGFALEHHRQRLNDEMQRADEDAAAIQRRLRHIEADPF